MSGTRMRFDVGAMMKARKEGKLQHDKIVTEKANIAKKRKSLQTLNMKQTERLDTKVSFH